MRRACLHVRCEEARLSRAKSASEVAVYFLMELSRSLASSGCPFRRRRHGRIDPSRSASQRRDDAGMRERTEFALRSGTEVTDILADRWVTTSRCAGVAPALFLGGNDALPHGVEGQLDLGSKAELLHGVSAVGLDGPAADEQAGPDLGVAVTLGREPQDLPLPRREPVVRVGLHLGAADVGLDG